MLIQDATYAARRLPMPETEKAHSKQASLEGQAILAYPDADIRCRRIWKGGQYVAVAPLGHLQPAGSTIALCGIETGCGNYATEDALRLCRNCVTKAVSPAQGISEVRAERDVAAKNLIELASAHITVTLDRDALRARNAALVAALEKIAKYARPPSGAWAYDALAADDAAT